MNKQESKAEKGCGKDICANCGMHKKEYIEKKGKWKLWNGFKYCYEFKQELKNKLENGGLKDEK